MVTAPVNTNIDFFVPPADGSMPFNWSRPHCPAGVPLTNWQPATHSVQVENVRGHESEYTLDTAGFEFHNAPSEGIDFENEESIKTKYYADAIQNIKKHTGASRVVVFQHVVRKSGPSDTKKPMGHKPALMPHVDQSANAAPLRVHRHLPDEDVSDLLSKRYQIINLWRPIGNPAWRFPLAICDYRSINTDDQDGDLVPSMLKLRDGDEETLVVKHNDAQRWKYLAGMTPDEFILIKCFDSKPDVAKCGPHTAIVDPTTPADAPDRQSIELRALVFYD